MKKTRFIYGSILMVIVNFVLRFISFSYDVILSKYIGAEGMGLFQMASSVLMLFLAISTMGISTSVSKLVAEENSKNNHYTVKKIYKVSAFFTFILSISLCLILISFARLISTQVFKNENMMTYIYLLAPAVVIIPMNNVTKGYFYGLKMVGAASFSEVVEHITKFIIVLSILKNIRPVTPMKGALVAICGISIGEFFNSLWLILMHRRSNKKLTNSIPIKINSISILAKMLKIAVPLTMSGLMGVLLQFINTILIPNRLMAAGYTNSQAIATFGRVSGMAMPLIFIPFIVTSALVVNIIPSLSEQAALKSYRNMKSDILLAIKIALIVSIPLTMFFAFFSQQLGLFLYSDDIVGRYIYIMGFSTVFVAMQHTLTGILHGLNKQKNTAINQFIGMFFQLLAIYYLVGNPRFGINGFFIGFFLRIIIVCTLDFIVLRKMMKIKINYIDLILKPSAASTLMIVSIYLSQQYLLKADNAMGFVSSLIIGGISYGFVLYITKAIPKKSHWFK